eukprot:576783-Prorocentrum_minimum.AAC.3
MRAGCKSASRATLYLPHESVPWFVLRPGCKGRGEGSGEQAEGGGAAAEAGAEVTLLGEVRVAAGGPAGLTLDALGFNGLADQDSAVNGHLRGGSKVASAQHLRRY